MCLLYKFPFNLNQSDILNYAQTWKSDLTSCQKNDGTLEQQNKASHILAMLLARKMYDKSIQNFVWGTQQQNFRKKLSLKSGLVILKRYV